MNLVERWIADESQPRGLAVHAEHVDYAILPYAPAVFAVPSRDTPTSSLTCAWGASDPSGRARDRGGIDFEPVHL
jgi:hypothetical protein